MLYHPEYKISPVQTNSDNRKHIRKLQVLLVTCFVLILTTVAILLLEDYATFLDKEENAQVASRWQIHEQKHQFDRKNAQKSSAEQRLLINVQLPVCNCTRTLNVGPLLLTGGISHSSCSTTSTLRGTGLRVISFSLFGAGLNATSPYFSGFEQNIPLVSQYYPGWIVRIYAPARVIQQDSSLRHRMCAVVCQNNHVDWCDVNDIPLLGNIEDKIDGHSWRFLVVGDPTVDVYLLRDVDSFVSPREVAAVKQWMSSGKRFHVMRDHPFHGVEMLAGMWGGRAIDRPGDVVLRERMIDRLNAKKGVETDQQMLREIVWPVVKNNHIAHDSYLCQRYPSTVPWPTKRIGPADFVGNPITRTRKFDLMGSRNYCPVKCRPVGHKDWIFC